MLKNLIMAGAVSAALGLSGMAVGAPTFSWNSNPAGDANYTDVGNAFGTWFGGNSSSVKILETGTLFLDSPGIITIEYLGHESAFTNNQFWWNSLGPSGTGTLIAQTGGGGQVPPGSPPPPPSPLGLQTGGTSYDTGAVDAGKLQFYFLMTDTSSPLNPHLVENGHTDTGEPNRGDDIGYWFGPGVDGGLLPTSGSSVYLLLDDGGAGPDNDHDDMIMRLTVREVPEPSTWALMLSGLGLLGFMAKRRIRS